MPRYTDVLLPLKNVPQISCQRHGVFDNKTAGTNPRPSIEIDIKAGEVVVSDEAQTLNVYVVFGVTGTICLQT